VVGRSSRAVFLWTAAAELAVFYLALSLVDYHLGGDPAVSVIVMASYVLAMALSVLAGNRLWMNIAAGVVVVGASAVLAMAELVSATTPELLWAGVLQVFLVALAWLAGITVAPGNVDYVRIAGRFQWSLPGFLILAGLGGMSFLPVLIFAITSAIALGLGRWHDSVRRVQGVLRPPPARLLTAGLGAVIVPVAVACVWLSPEAAGAVVNGLSAVWKWLTPERLAESSGRQFEFRLSCEFRPEDEGAFEMPEPGRGSGGSPQWVAWVMLGVIAAAILAGVVLAAMRLRARRKAAAPEIPRIETVTIGLGLLGSMWRKIRDVFVSLWHWLRQALTRRQHPDEEPGATVRAIYRSFLAWAARRGLPRAPSQTPLEYLGLLMGAFPKLAVEFGTITASYVEARYGRGTADPGVIPVLRGAWHRILTAGDERKAGRTLTRQRRKL
jgi:hypothetical protein